MRGAHDSIKPEVKRSETPGTMSIQLVSPRSGRQLAKNLHIIPRAIYLMIGLSPASRATRLEPNMILVFRCRSTPGFMLTPATRALFLRIAREGKQSMRDGNQHEVVYCHCRG
jgi:hypothetical protein